MWFVLTCLSVNFPEIPKIETDFLRILGEATQLTVCLLKVELGTIKKENIFID